MNINKIQNINFKANYFKVYKVGRYIHFERVLTDNEENLGKEPILESERYGEISKFPMVYDGKYYGPECCVLPEKYRIFYKDTGKYERNGEKQIINLSHYIDIATRADRTRSCNALEYPIARGEAKGKVFVNTFDIPQDIPAILILDEIKTEASLVDEIPENVMGVIVSSAEFSLLDHCSNLIRNRYPVFSIIWDTDKFNTLKQQEGKYLSVNNSNGILNYTDAKQQELTKSTVNTISITPPKLENVEQFLTFDELTPQNCGNKGYRLSIIKKLIEEGKLKDISLPQGFVIPEGYINKFKEYINIEDKDKLNDKLGIYTQGVKKKIEELGMDSEHLIVRSNFNTEDLNTEDSSFSSAGIYKSQKPYNDPILPAVVEVIKSKDSHFAQYIHKKYGIEDNQIQPSVIIQDKIASRYEFTIYSDDGNNNMIIQFADNLSGHTEPNKALIRYDKKTKELTIEREESAFAKYLIDENGNVIDEYHKENTIVKDWNIITPLLSIVTAGALVLEKFFKHPQDIEGGIAKNGKVFFWQTRDIVAKAVKKI